MKENNCYCYPFLKIQRCCDDSTCHLSESAKTNSDHLETMSQLSFMELRLDVGAKR